MTKKPNRKLKLTAPVFEEPTNPFENLRIHLKYKNQAQREFVELINANEITICSGSPGTGKTILSCLAALKLLKENPIYKKIILVKSVTVLKDEEIGFLKGTMEEKMEPYMYSFIYNFERIIPKEDVRWMRQFGHIEVLPIAFLRGVTLSDCIIIADECQNASIDNMITLMTRIGENSKLILLGDEQQIDMKDKKSSSLKWLMQNFQSIEGIGTFRFGEESVVRNPIIKKILTVVNSVSRA